MNGLLGSIAVLSTLLSAQSLALEYVSQKKAADLAKIFASAQPISAANAKSLSGRGYTCDMFGMRTRLQVERNVKLYNFTQSSSGWTNQGAQVVASYQLAARGLVGTHSTIRDEIRMTNSGQLISELSKEDELSLRNVLAYSLCSQH